MSFRATGFFVVYLPERIVIMSSSPQKDEVYKLTKELLDNKQHVSNIQIKIKCHKDEIKSYSERNEIIMGELRVHTDFDDLDIDKD